MTTTSPGKHVTTYVNGKLGKRKNKITRSQESRVGPGQDKVRVAIATGVHSFSLRMKG